MRNNDHNQPIDGRQSVDYEKPRLPDITFHHLLYPKEQCNRQLG